VPDFSLMASHFGPIEATLAPADLMCADPRLLRPPNHVDVDQVPKSDQRVAKLVESVSVEDRNEADVLDVTSPMFVAMLGHEIVSVCGYRVWVGALAHLSVLTHPDARNRGFAKSVGGASAAHAPANGLVPQWRARPKASQAVGRSLGFQALGAQLSLRIAAASSS
jgi:GNAT acetyltransferase